jgi:hypothetical protein
MRQLLVIFMLLVLPLRGWTGDAMAYGMLGGQVGKVTAINSIAAHTNIPSVSDAFVNESAPIAMPCHGINTASADDSQSTPATQNQCTHCQVCHLSPFAVHTSATPVVLLPQAAPVHNHTKWMSADVSRLSKPPFV